MAEETPKTNGNGEPPKIKLTNGNGGATPPPPEEPVKPVAPGKAPPKISIKSAEKKSDTSRIDLASAQPPPAAPAGTGPKKVTIRVTRPLTTIKKPGIPQTGGIPKAPTAATPPVSIKPAAEEQKKKSETTRLSIPTPVAPAAEGHTSITLPPSSETTAEAKKSETARIELPHEITEARPATRPKTIRIKRPDAAGIAAKKSLTISRPSVADTAKAKPSSTAAPIAAETETQQEVGSLFTIAAAVAVIVTGVLVYVLMAQTIATNLSFPGKII